MFIILDTTINIMQTPVRALLADVSTEAQSSTSQVVVTLFQGLGALASFGLQLLWENPADHMLEMFTLMIAVNIMCVLLMLLVTTEKQFVPNADSRNVVVEEPSSLCGLVFGMFKSLLQIPKFLIHLSLVQTLVWMGLSMWNKNASLWFGETLFGGDGTAAAGTPEKVAFDHGIAAF